MLCLLGKPDSRKGSGMKFNDQRQVSGHRRTEAEQKAIRAKFIDATPRALRRRNYPKQELEKALKAVGLWEHNGRVA